MERDFYNILTSAQCRRSYIVIQKLTPNCQHHCQVVILLIYWSVYFGTNISSWRQWGAFKTSPRNWHSCIKNIGLFHSQAFLHKIFAYKKPQVLQQSEKNFLIFMLCFIIILRQFRFYVEKLYRIHMVFHSKCNPIKIWSQK